MPSYTVIGRNSGVLPPADTPSFGGDFDASESILLQRGIAQQSWANEEVQRNERESVHVA